MASIFHETQRCVTCARDVCCSCIRCNDCFCWNCLINHQNEMKAQFHSSIGEHHQSRTCYGRSTAVQVHRSFSDTNIQEQRTAEIGNKLRHMAEQRKKQINTWSSEIDYSVCDEDEDHAYWSEPSITMKRGLDRPLGFDLGVDKGSSPICPIKQEIMEEDIPVQSYMASSESNDLFDSNNIPEEYRMKHHSDSLEINKQVNKQEKDNYGDQLDQTGNGNVILLEIAPSNGSELSEGLLKLAIGHVIAIQKIGNWLTQLKEFGQSTLIVNMLGLSLAEQDKQLTDIYERTEIRSIYIRDNPPDTDDEREYFFSKYPMIKAMFENEKSLLTQWTLDTANEYKRIGDRCIAKGDKDLAQQYFTKGVTLYKRLSTYLSEKKT